MWKRDRGSCKHDYEIEALLVYLKKEKVKRSFVCSSHLLSILALPLLLPPLFLFIFCHYDFLHFISPFSFLFPDSSAALVFFPSNLLPNASHDPTKPTGLHLKGNLPEHSSTDIKWGFYSNLFIATSVIVGQRTRWYIMLEWMHGSMRTTLNLNAPLLSGYSRRITC